MGWLLAIFVVAGAAILLRIYFHVRKLRTPENDDWDAKQITYLRSHGSDPFQSHEVDFFFGLPNEPACQAVRQQLELEGFAVDAKPVPEAVDQVFSLHARKQMRLSVPDMQALTRRFGELARLNGGRYDGWTAGVVPKPAGDDR
ncbi:MAG TPA: ribonuclease E inhibitor RraB [Steroidobacteraceae bacterium]|nr:ribonuclease E inhibitor RraB [Steroidobacteraceae bacterium]